MSSTIETKEEFHRRKSKEHYQKNKLKYNERNQQQKARTYQLILQAKKDGCIICNEDFPPALDFHHINGEEDKVQEISAMRGMNDNKVLAEIAKCVVLCRNCHAKVHNGNFSLWPRKILE